MLSRSAIVSSVCALTLLLAAACGKDSKPPAPGPGNVPTEARSTYEGVEYADKTAVIDEDAMRSGLRGEDGKTFRFAEGTKGVDKLAAGSVALFAGTAVRKVTSVRKSGGEVVVQTADAKLNDLIKKGRIGYSGPMTWSKLPRESFRDIKFGVNDRQPLLANVANVTNVTGVESQQELSIVKKWNIEGFDIELKLTPKPDKLEFEIDAQRSPTIRVTGKGSISNFGFQTDLEYDQAAGQLIETEVLDIKGEAELTWAAVGVGNKGLDTETVRLKLPFEVPFPFFVGGLPFVLKVKSEVRIVPVLAENSSSGGSFKVTYDADTGFTTSKGALPKSKSTVHDSDAELGDKETVTAGFVPVGFAWGWEFPRLELSMVGIGTFAFISQDTFMSGEFTRGTTLTADIPPCQRASVTLHAIAGYKLEILGFVAAKDQTTLWEKKVEKFKDDKPCTLTGGNRIKP